jgi:hypothetical protein
MGPPAYADGAWRLIAFGCRDFILAATLSLAPLAGNCVSTALPRLHGFHADLVVPASRALRDQCRAG